MSINIDASREKELLENMARRLVEVDGAWENYRSIVNKALEDWLDVRREVVNKIAELKGVISYCEERLKELDARVKIGLISEEEAVSKRERLANLIENAKLSAEDLEEKLRDLEKRLKGHHRKVGPPITLRTVNELKDKMAELNELYSQGAITESTYRDVKNMLVLALEALEELVKNAETEGVDAAPKSRHTN